MKQILFLLLACICLPLSAENIIFRADSMTGSSSESAEYAKLNGNATIITPTMEIYADTIEMSGKNYRYIKASGNVSGTNTESKIDFTCEQLIYDRDTEVATMQNTVHLVDRENETVANAEVMDYDKKKDTVIMQISVTMQQKNNICIGSHAVYNTATRMLYLSGNPQITQGSDVFRAQEISLNLDTQEVQLHGRVRGSVTDND